MSTTITHRTYQQAMRDAEAFRALFPRESWKVWTVAAALRRFTRTRVIVSYYDDPALAALYPGWIKKLHTRTKSLVSQGKRGNLNETVAPEVLLINGPSYATEGR